MSQISLTQWRRDINPVMAFLKMIHRGEKKNPEMFEMPSECQVTGIERSACESTLSLSLRTAFWHRDQPTSKKPQQNCANYFVIILSIMQMLSLRSQNNSSAHPHISVQHTLTWTPTHTQPHPQSREKWNLKLCPRKTGINPLLPWRWVVYLLSDRWCCARIYFTSPLPHQIEAGDTKKPIKLKDERIELII